MVLQPAHGLIGLFKKTRDEVNACLYPLEVYTSISLTNTLEKIKIKNSFKSLKDIPRKSVEVKRKYITNCKHKLKTANKNSLPCKRKICQNQSKRDSFETSWVVNNCYILYDSSSVFILSNSDLKAVIITSSSVNKSYPVFWNTIIPFIP